jgi:hypothetical protein
MKLDASLKGLLKATLMGAGAAIAVWLTLSFYTSYSSVISAIVGGVAGAYYYRASLRNGLIIGTSSALVYVLLAVILTDALALLGITGFLSLGTIVLLLPEFLLSLLGGLGGGALGAFLVNLLVHWGPRESLPKLTITPEAKVLLQEKTDSDLGEGELILTEKEVAYARPKFMGTEFVGVLPLDQIVELGVQEDDLIIGSKIKSHEFGVQDPESWVKTVKEAMHNFVKKDESEVSPASAKVGL